MHFKKTHLRPFCLKYLILWTLLIFFIVVYQSTWYVKDIFGNTAYFCDIQPIYQYVQSSKQQERLLTQEERHKLNESNHCEVTKLGCFTYVKPNKPLLSSKSSLSMTKTSCFTQCSSIRLPLYIGFTHGNTCSCTTIIKDYTTFLNRNKCSKKCSGNENETCGGEKGIEWHVIRKPCIKGEDLSISIEDSHFVGCFADSVKQKLLSSICVDRTLYISRPTCILHCGVKGSPLALVDDASSTCVCARFTQNLNRTHVKKCNENSLTIYRTFAEDDRCEPLKFLPSKSTVKKSVLLSFPGSGNTWVRHMIEQVSGIYTGSVYGSPTLSKSGFLGESPSVASNLTFVIKDHMFRGNNTKIYHSIIFLIRNPYDAHIAEFNRLQTENKLGFANKQAFFSKKFRERITGERHSASWDILFRYVAESKKPFHLLRYEDLIQDPIFEIEKVMKFLEKTNGFKLDNFEQRILCLSQNLQGGYKRKKKKDKFDPFTNELKAKLNSLIDSAQSILAELGLPDDFTNYKRIV